MEILQGNCIERKGERIASAVVSVKARTANSPHEHVRRLLYADMVQSGAGKYDRDAWQHALGNLGASISVSLDDGDIDFSLRSIDMSLGKTLRLFTELFASPRFDESELVRAKTNLKNRLILAKEDARAVSYQMFASRVFDQQDRRTSYAAADIEKEVAAISIDDMHALHASLWSYPWIYTCGGSRELNTAVETALRKIHAMRTNEQLESALFATKPPVHAMALSDIPNKQNIEFSMGGALPFMRTHEAYSAFMFGMSVLAFPGGFVGRLMSIVREKEGLTYGIYGKPEHTTADEPGVWRIGTFFAPKDAVKGITSTLREIRRMKDGGITEDELKRFKTILHTRYALVEDSLIKKVAESHTLKKSGIDADMYAAFKNELQHMDKKRVDAAMRTYLDDARLIISGAGPVEGIRKELAVFAQ